MNKNANKDDLHNSLTVKKIKKKQQSGSYRIS